MERVREETTQYRLVPIKGTEIERVQIQSSVNAVKYARQFYKEDLSIYESVFLILLDRSSSTVGYVKISQGGIASTVVDPLIVARYAVTGLASSVIMVHNHPSGNKEFSSQDLSIGEKIKKVLNIVGSQLTDSIVITESSYNSMADNGLL